MALLKAQPNRLRFSTFLNPLPISFYLLPTYHNRQCVLRFCYQIPNFYESTDTCEIAWLVCSRIDLSKTKGLVPRGHPRSTHQPKRFWVALHQVSHNQRSDTSSPPLVGYNYGRQFPRAIAMGLDLSTALQDPVLIRHDDKPLPFQSERVESVSGYQLFYRNLVTTTCRP
jgi:hypothetical protein